MDSFGSFNSQLRGAHPGSYSRGSGYSAVAEARDSHSSTRHTGKARRGRRIERSSACHTPTHPTQPYRHTSAPRPTALCSMYRAVHDQEAASSTEAPTLLHSTQAASAKKRDDGTLKNAKSPPPKKPTRRPAILRAREPLRRRSARMARSARGNHAGAPRTAAAPLKSDFAPCNG